MSYREEEITMISIWEEGMGELQPNLLKKDKSCQILILGANLAGLFTALFCKRKGLDVIVVEEETVDQRALEIDFFERITDLKTWTYSIRYPYICMRYQIDCQCRRLPSFYYWLAPKPTAHMPKHPVFHPVEMTRGLASLLEVYEKVSIHEIKEKRLITEAEYINFEYMIDARLKESEESEGWIAASNVELNPGVYLCMDDEANLLVWNEKVVMRNSYRFLFPGAVIENEWKVNCGRKEGIFTSMDRAVRYMKEISQNHNLIKNKS